MFWVLFVWDGLKAGWRQRFALGGIGSSGGMRFLNWSENGRRGGFRLRGLLLMAVFSELDQGRLQDSAREALALNPAVFSELKETRDRGDFEGTYTLSARFCLAPVCETRTIETNNVGLVSSFCETTGARNKGAGRENTMRIKNKVVEFFNIATRNAMGG